MIQKITIPSWLETSPSSNVSPPVDTRRQKLPFNELSWEDFEKLCLRIVKKEADVEHCQLYGERGQDQKGIDLYARKLQSDKFSVYQCKRQKEFGPAKIEAAVKKFLKGEWVSKTETLVLCTMESLVSRQRADKLEEQNKLLNEKGIRLIPWDCHQLSIKLKKSPEIVVDFFGVAWAHSFCGEEQVNRISRRQIDDDYFDSIMAKYCKWISKTSATFNIVGLGLALPISKAWMELNVLAKENPNYITDKKQALEKLIKQYHEWERLSERKRDISPKNAEYIAAFNNRIVVIGGPGAGKSTLLKRLAHKYSNENKIVLWVRLPRIIHQMDKSGDNFEEVLVRTSFDGSGFSFENQKRISSNPDYILADGLDECDPKRSEIVDALVRWGHGHKKTTIIVSTRPIGHDAGFFPDWKHYEILPLRKSNILIYFRQIVNELFKNDKDRIEKELNVFNQNLASNKTASIAARNPLLLGFLIQLSVNNFELGKRRVSLYDQIIRCIQSYSPLDRKIKIASDDTLFFRAFEIFGWLLQKKPLLPYPDLLNQTGNILKDELGIGVLLAQRKAEQALNFWIERRLMEKLSVGGNEYIFFIHMTLGEFAAARYAISQEQNQLIKWLTRVRRKTKWRETILLAAGLEGGERILQILIDMEDPDDRTSREAMLAASALSEIEDPSIDLVETIAHSLLLRLTSNIRNVVLETGYAALKLIQFVPEIIGPVAQSLLEHPQPLTRFVAWNLALHSGNQYFDIDLLDKHYEEFFDLI